MNTNKLIKSLIFYMFSAFGISLTIKAMIGVSSFNSLNVALANVTTIKIGTITTIINCCFLLLCWFLDNQRAIKPYFMMLMALLLFGTIINLFLYTFLKSVTISNYFLRVLLFIVGTTISGYSTGRALSLNLLKFPIEHFCVLIANRSNRSFKFYRYSIDIFCVSFSLLLSWLYQLPIVVREGTVISLFLLSFMISWAKEKE